MYVCLCKAVTDTQIRESIQNGATKFGQVRQELSLASQCGKCGILAREVFNEALESTIDDQQLFYAVS
jgi:bacterioferritin-associated ferredoxin